MNNFTVCTRLSEQTLYKLDWLCDALKLRRSEVITDCICNAFDNLNGNEELKALFGQLEDIQSQMRNIADSLK